MTDPTLTVAHRYVSTACFHELHESCRQHCKFCAAFCRCQCHNHLPPQKRKHHE